MEIAVKKQLAIRRAVREDHVMATLERLLYDRKTAALVLSVSIRTIDYALARQEFEWRRIGRRKLITSKSLRSWANKNHYGSVKEPKPEEDESVRI
jgi:hypothetical protein